MFVLVALEGAFASPEAVISASPNPVARNVSVTFSGVGSTADSGRMIMTYAWSFGDGSNATGKTAGHTYFNSGLYTCKLVVTDNGIPALKGTNSVVVHALTPVRAPVARTTGPFIADLDGGMSLYATNSYDLDAIYGDTITNYAWSIDSGALLLTGATPAMSQSQLVSLAAGAHAVSLTVVDTEGLMGCINTMLNIYSNMPSARFTISTNPVACNQAIVFDASASQAGRPDRSLTGYAWSFGDGSTTSGVTAIHAYTNFGAYTVRLVVSDTNATPRSDTNAQAVAVNQGNHPPVGDPWGPYQMVEQNNLTLHCSIVEPDAAYGDFVTQVVWRVGGHDLLTVVPSRGETNLTCACRWASLASFTSEWALPRNTPLPVELVVIDSLGAESETDTTLAVYENDPIASFSISTNICYPNTPLTYDASTSTTRVPWRTIGVYQWNFSGCTNASESVSFPVEAEGLVVTNTYQEPGLHYAALACVDSQGYLSMAEHPVYVKGLPVAVGEASTSAVTMGLSSGLVTFRHDASTQTNFSWSALSIVDYQWLFDVNSGTVTNDFAAVSWNALSNNAYSADGKAWHGSSPSSRCSFAYLWPSNYYAALRVVNNEQVSSIALVGPITCLRLPVVAEAGGPYWVSSGKSVELAGVVTDPCVPILPEQRLVYGWDVTGDGVSDLTNAIVALTWDALMALNLRKDVPKTIQFMVTDDAGRTQTSETTLHLAPDVSFASVMRVGDAFHFSLTGDVGYCYQLQVSTNLHAWSSLGTLNNSSGLMIFTNPVAGSPVRFYRAVWTP